MSETPTTILGAMQDFKSPTDPTPSPSPSTEQPTPTNPQEATPQPPQQQQQQNPSIVDPLTSTDTKPYTKYTWDELKDAFNKGLIDADTLTYVTLKKMVALDIDSMDPGDVKQALKLDIINAHDAEQYAQKRLNPFAFYAHDVGVGVVHGTVSLADSLNTAASQFASALTGGLIDPKAIATNAAEGVAKPQTLPGEIASGMTQYMDLFLPMSKGMKSVYGAMPVVQEMAKTAPKLIPWIEEAINGMATGYLAFDPAKSGRLSDALHEWGAGKTPIVGPIVEFLKTNPSGSVGVERLKQALEGLYTGVVADVLFKGLSFTKASIWNKFHGDSEAVGNAVNKLAEGSLDSPGSIGSLAAKYESGGSSSSIGYDAKGGTSYGMYQIASKPGTFEAFLKYLDEKNPTLAHFLRSAGPADTGSTTGAVPDMWKQLSKDGMIQPYERSFIENTHYQPAYNLLTPEVQKFVDSTPGMKEVLFSHSLSGPAYAKDFNIAYDETIAKGKPVESFIDRVYDLRLTHFKGDNQNLVRKRFEVSEREDAKRLILGDTTGTDIMPKPQGEETAQAPLTGESSKPSGDVPTTTGEVDTSPPAEPKNPAIVFKDDVEHGNAIIDVLARKEESSDRSLHIGPAEETSSMVNWYRKETGDMCDVMSAVYSATRDKISAAKRLGMSIPEMRAAATDMKKVADNIFGQREYTTEAAQRATEMEGFLATSFQMLESQRKAIEGLADRASTMPENELAVQAKAQLSAYADLLANIESIRSSTSRMMNMQRGSLKDRFNLDINPADVKPEDVVTIKRTLNAFKNAKDDKARYLIADGMQNFKVLRYGLELAQANLLWGFWTHTRNFTSQMAKFLNDEVISKWGAIGYEAMKTGQWGMLKQAEVEAKAMVFGLVQALRMPGLFSKLFKGDWKEFFQGFKDNPEMGNAWKALWTGESVTDPFERIAKSGKVTTSERDTLEKYLNNINVMGMQLPIGTLMTFSFRGLTAEDEAFSTVIMNKTVAGGLFEQAYRAGLKGKELQAYIDEFMSHPPKALIEEGIRRKRNVTFTQSGGGITTSDSGLKAVGLVAKLMIMPFFRISWNMFKSTVSDSPLGLLSNQFRTAWNAGGRTRYEAVARIATGSAYLATGWALAEWMGYQAAVPPETKKAYNLAGVPQYSLRDDKGNWSDLPNMLGPISSLINAGANINHFMRYKNSYDEDMSMEEDEKFQRIATMGMLVAFSPFFEQHWNTCLRDLSNLANGTINFQQFAVKEAEKFLPMESLFPQFKHITDPLNREVNSLSDLIESKYGDTTKLLPKRDVLYGDVTELPTHSVLGATVRKDRLDDPVVREMFRLGMSPGAYSKDKALSGIKVPLTPEQVNSAQEYVSKSSMKEFLTKLVQDPRYQSMSGGPTEQAKLLKAIVGTYRRAAYSNLMATTPELQQQVVDKLNHKRDTLVGASIDPSPTGRVTNLLQLIKQPY